MITPCGPRNFEAGKKAAFYMGKESKANPTESVKDYKDSAAFYFGEGIEEFSDLNRNQKTALIREFDRGRR